MPWMRFYLQLRRVSLYGTARTQACCIATCTSRTNLRLAAATMTAAQTGPTQSRDSAHGHDPRHRCRVGSVPTDAACEGTNHKPYDSDASMACALTPSRQHSMSSKSMKGVHGIHETRMDSDRHTSASHHSTEMICSSARLCLAMKSLTHTHDTGFRKRPSDRVPFPVHHHGRHTRHRYNPRDSDDGIAVDRLCVALRQCQRELRGREMLERLLHAHFPHMASASVSPTTFIAFDNNPDVMSSESGDSHMHRNDVNDMSRRTSVSSTNCVWLSDRCVYELLLALYTHRHPHFMLYYRHLHNGITSHESALGHRSTAWKKRSEQSNGQCSPTSSNTINGSNSRANLSVGVDKVFLSRVRRVLLALVWAKEQRGRLDVRDICYVATEAAVWLTTLTGRPSDCMDRVNTEDSTTQGRLPVSMLRRLRQRCWALRAEYAPVWWARAAQDVHVLHLQSARIAQKTDGHLAAYHMDSSRPFDSHDVTSNRTTTPTKSTAITSNGTSATHDRITIAKQYCPLSCRCSLFRMDVCEAGAAASAFQQVFVHSSLPHSGMCCTSSVYRRLALPRPESIHRLMQCATLSQINYTRTTTLCAERGGSVHEQHQRRMQWLSFVQHHGVR